MSITREERLQQIQAELKTNRQGIDHLFKHEQELSREESEIRQQIALEEELPNIQKIRIENGYLQIGGNSYKITDKSVISIERNPQAFGRNYYRNTQITINIPSKKTITIDAKNMLIKEATYGRLCEVLDIPYLPE